MLVLTYVIMTAISPIAIIIIIHEYYYGGAVALLLQDHLTMSMSNIILDQRFGGLISRGNYAYLSYGHWPL